MNCSAKPDWSMTSTVLSLNVFSARGRCQTRLVEDAAFFGSDDFSYFKWQKSLCVVCASCVLYIDMMDEPANSRHNDSRTNEEIQVLADPHNRRDDGRLCAILFYKKQIVFAWRCRKWKSGSHIG